MIGTTFRATLIITVVISNQGESGKVESVRRNHTKNQSQILTHCYKELGCFPMDYPWTSLLRPLPPPLPPWEINTQIYCYSRYTSQRYKISLWPKISLNGFPFQGQNRTTVLITHGFINTANDTWLADLKDAYLESVDANVCLVDWGQGAKNLNYLQVASSTRIVGAEIARFIKHLQKKKKLSVNHLHLIGHSLGAHIMGYAAKSVPGISRVTGLDAAQPGFEGCDKRVRLDKQDAQFVDGIHTNGSPLIPTMGFGFIMPFGHVDIYMNGGLRQPGCDLPRISDIRSVADLAYYPIEMVSRWVACSHKRAIDYFTQSLQKNCTIWARAGSIAYHMVSDSIQGLLDPLYSNVNTCNVSFCIPLGLNTPKFNARGTFASCTAGVSPYCDAPEVNKKITNDILKSSENLSKTLVEVLNQTAKNAGMQLEETLKMAGHFTGKVEEILGGTSKRTMKLILAVAFTCLLVTQGEAGLLSLLSSAVSAVTSTISSFVNGSCYDGIGCFPNSAPWFTALRLFPAPKSPDEINVQLYCYTRDSSERYNVSVWPSIDMNGFPFQAENRTTVLITHGFGNNGNMSWQDQMKDGYLSLVDANVCIVDWGTGACDGNYLQVASNTRIVGAVVARFVRYLQSDYGLNASNIHLIGHSLGSHISSYIATNVTGVARITGLDVAQPGFEGYDKEVRLDADDADFVDTIHSNGLPFLPSAGFGFQRAVGDVDIYLNGGRFQPGCESIQLSNFSSLSELATVSVNSLINWVGCSHGKSFEAFIATLNSTCQLWARSTTLSSSYIASNSTIESCNATTCLRVGLDTPKFAGRGVFIAYGNSTVNFCDSEEVCAKYQSEVESSSS